MPAGTSHLQINYGGEDAPFPWFWLVMFGLYALVEFACLYRILTRRDFDTQQRILRVLVAQFAPLGGMVLHLMVTPLVPAAGGCELVSGSDMAGTPWRSNPGHTRLPRGN